MGGGIGGSGGGGIGGVSGAEFPCSPKSAASSSSASDAASTPFGRARKERELSVVAEVAESTVAESKDVAESEEVVESKGFVGIAGSGGMITLVLAGDAYLVIIMLGVKLLVASHSTTLPSGEYK